MSNGIQELLDRNAAWAAQIEQDDPGFFAGLAKGQNPQYLWIGCADSRVPPTEITGLAPGDIFVHRNVANVVSSEDANCMSVLDFAVRHVKVSHVIVCGHYGCAGVRAAMENAAEGVVGEWLTGVRQVWLDNESDLADLAPDDAAARLCELSVADQVRTVCATSAVKDTWQAGGDLEVHGLIYDLETGRIRDLGIRITGEADL